MKLKRSSILAISLVLMVIFVACSLPTATAQPTKALATATQPAATAVPPTATEVPPTVTPVPPTATSVPPTATAVPPTAVPTATGVPPLATPVGKAIDITYIHMADLSTGWGIGGKNKASDHVYRTKDGGQTWRDVTPAHPAVPAGVEFLGYFKDANTGWVVFGPAFGAAIPANIHVWSTFDGGATWAAGPVSTAASSGESFSPSLLTFADKKHGWLMVVLGAGMMHQYVALYGTSDGGLTWNTLISPSLNDGGIQSFPKTGMGFADALNGWLTRDGEGVDMTPHVFKTADGGASWQRIDLPTPAGKPNFFTNYVCGSYSPNVFSAKAVTVALKCLDAVNYKTERDYVYSTTDGGSTWKAYALPDTYIMGEGLLFLDANIGVALGKKIFKTDDGGKTWIYAGDVSWVGQFSYVDISHAWAVARNPDTGEIALVKTSNTAGPWKMLYPVMVP